MRILIISLMALMLGGCASIQYNHLSNKELPKLDPAGSAYILSPANAMYFSKECVGSGKIIGDLIYSAFAKHLNRVEIAAEGQKIEEGLQKAKGSGFTYLVNPKIFIWEDHATEWNGAVDQLDMQIDIIDVKSSDLLDSVHFGGNGTWFTFGGYHPQNIAAKSIDEYVASLFPSNVKSMDAK
jgi:hypothetical protein